jgi:hypothetical protein
MEKISGERLEMYLKLSVVHVDFQLLAAQVPLERLPDPQFVVQPIDRIVLNFNTIRVLLL